MIDLSDILISYVIPVYNVEKYIKKCVKSVQQQQHKNFEIILIDDGSTDNSASIIDELAKSDKSIQCIHQKNKGVSNARNKGIEKSKGDYIIFVDSDDYLEPDYSTYFLNLIINNKCDIAIGVNCFCLGNQNQVKKDNVHCECSEKIIEDIYLQKINVAVWNKIYKRDFIIKNNIRFDEKIWFGEGMLFNIMCLQYTDFVGVGYRKVYHQFYNPNSAMRKFSLQSNYCGIKSLEIQKNIWIKKNKKIEKAWDYHYHCFSFSILNGILKTDTKEKYKIEYNRCKKNLRKNLFQTLMLSIPIRQKLAFVVAFFSPDLLVKRSIWKEKQKIRKLNFQEENTHD